jgi:ubiquinone/menaquinone biosynthesis C-methylase UbiE
MRPWNAFFNDRIRTIFAEGADVLDIGGGLRISKEKGNRFNEKNAWMRELADKVSYKIVDPVPTYHPDIVGDIEHLPLPDASVDAVICLSVLESVKNPAKGVAEIQRVLKPGGRCLAYVPFLYYYHAEPGYYRDYWRFTEDAAALLFESFSNVEIKQLHGAVESWIKLSPFGRSKTLLSLGRAADIFFKKTDSKETSGFYIFATK